VKGRSLQILKELYGSGGRRVVPIYSVVKRKAILREEAGSAGPVGSLPLTSDRLRSPIYTRRRREVNAGRSCAKGRAVLACSVETQLRA